MNKASPFSKEQYYPMMLSNGKDAVMIDYTGSMFSGLTGHAHYEQHQSTPCGWYKIAHQSKILNALQSVICSGYQVIVSGEVCELKHYEQEFIPSKATLISELVFFADVKIRIESFLNDAGILSEHYTVLETPKNKIVDIAFVALKPHSAAVAIGLRVEPEFNMNEYPNGMKFDYGLENKIKGQALMLTDREFDAYRDFRWESRGMFFMDVKAGWEATKFLIASDSAEMENYAEDIQEKSLICLKAGWDKLKLEHEKVWNDYFRQSKAVFPDKNFQYFYELGRYMMRANLHPESGGLTVGMLPHLWAGGINCTYDAWYMHQSLMLTNNIREAEKHLGYYEIQHPLGKQFAEKAGSAGAVFSGWTDCFGKHRGNNVEHYIMHYKPLMSGFIALAIYWQWRYCQDISKAQKNLLVDILDFVLANFVDDKGNYAIMKPCMAGNESEVEVTNDTYTGLTYARAFAGAAEITDNAEYRSISEKLYKGIEQNYNEEGILMPYAGAEYVAGMQFWAYMVSLPQGTPAESVYRTLEKITTYWGLDGEQPSEVYRHWPWCDGRVAVCMAHLEDSKTAFKHLMHNLEYSSSLGAIPEKIRMDGFAIGYWYSTPFGILIWAACAAICHIDKNNCLKLLYGLDGQWQDLSVTDLRLPGALLVSLEVKNGEMLKLEVKNETSNYIDIGLKLNPIYKGLIPESVKVTPNAIEKII